MPEKLAQPPIRCALRHGHPFDGLAYARSQCTLPLAHGDEHVDVDGVRWTQHRSDAGLALDWHYAQHCEPNRLAILDCPVAAALWDLMEDSERIAIA